MVDSALLKRTKELASVSNESFDTDAFVLSDTVPKMCVSSKVLIFVVNSKTNQPEFGLSNCPFSFDDFDIKRGFLGQEAICGHG